MKDAKFILSMFFSYFTSHYGLDVIQNIHRICNQEAGKFTIGFGEVVRTTVLCHKQLIIYVTAKVLCTSNVRKTNKETYLSVAV